MIVEARPFHFDPAGRPNWGGFASFSGVVMTASVQAQLLSRLLPRPLERIAGLHAGRHELIMLFGEISDGGGHVAGFDIPTAMRYREVAVLVPFVRHPGCDGPAIFPYRMFADDPLPVLLGNACYGLRKELARIDWGGADFQVHRSNRARFAASGALTSSWSEHLADDSQEFLALRKVLDLPVLGRRDTGDFVQLYFEWSFKRAQACEFVGHVDLLLDDASEALRLRGERAFAVRGMGFRTSAPRPVAHSS